MIAVWTARRIVLLIGGLLITLSGYAAYALFLGGIDGMAPLPLAWGKPEEGIGPVDDPPPPTGDAGRRLETAFGPNCEEKLRPLQLWLPDKGILFAAGDFQIIKADGRVRLAPFS